MSHSEQVRLPSWKRTTRFIVCLAGLASLLVLAACSGQSTAPATKSNTPAQKVAGASLVFDETEVDFGKVPFNKTVEKSFTYRNVGTKPVSIIEKPTVDIVEGCWPPQPVVSSTTVQPGQTGTLRIAMAMHEGMGGAHDFRITVKTNDPVQPETVLTVKAVFGP